MGRGSKGADLLFTRAGRRRLNTSSGAAQRIAAASAQGLQGILEELRAAEGGERRPAPSQWRLSAANALLERLTALHDQRGRGGLLAALGELALSDRGDLIERVWERGVLDGHDVGFLINALPGLIVAQPTATRLDAAAAEVIAEELCARDWREQEPLLGELASGFFVDELSSNPALAGACAKAVERARAETGRPDAAKSIGRYREGLELGELEVSPVHAVRRVCDERMALFEERRERLAAGEDAELPEAEMAELIAEAHERTIAEKALACLVHSLGEDNRAASWILKHDPTCRKREIALPGDPFELHSAMADAVFEGSGDPQRAAKLLGRWLREREEA